MTASPIVRSFWETRVDTSGSVWELAPGMSLYFDRTPTKEDEAGTEGDERDLEEAMRAYLRHRIARCSPYTIISEQKILSDVTSNPRLRSALDAPGTAVLSEAYQEWSKRLDHGSAAGAIGVLRNWYIWCVNRGHASFSPETAVAIGDATIRGPRKGRAVLRMDPEFGPLSTTEFRRLAAAIVDGAADGSVTLRHLTALALFVDLGCNPANLQWLNESDYQPSASEGEPAHLMVPRIKKGRPSPRMERRRRLLNPISDHLVHRLIEENRGRLPAPPTGERPLFLGRGAFSDDLSDEYLADGRVHVSWFYVVLKRLAGTMDLRADDGSRLHLNARRLRYTFATRAVAAGVRPGVLMHLLDHSDLTSVLIYYDGRLDVVDQLDVALKGRVDGIATAFLAPPGTTWQPARAGFDANAAPFACLTCSRFRPREARPLHALSGLLSAEASRVLLLDVGEADRISALASRSDLAARLCEVASAGGAPLQVCERMDARP